MGLSAVDGLLHRIQAQSPSTPTYPVYVRPGAAPTPHVDSIAWGRALSAKHLFEEVPDVVEESGVRLLRSRGRLGALDMDRGSGHRSGLRGVVSRFRDPRRRLGV